MNIADLAGPGRTPACWEKPDLFSAHALDFDPNAEEYVALDSATKAEMAQKKAEAEEAAVDVCFGCPLMLACEKIDEQNMANPRIPFIVGVIGGRTESERRARRSGRTVAPAAKTTSVPNPQIAPGDRGPRNQVDDDLVVRLSNAGKTSDQIARELNCSPRTVSRARKRNGISAPKASTSGADSFASRAAAETAETVSRTEKAAASTKPSRHLHAAAESPAVNPFIGGRPVSPAMEAVYNHLTTVGGSDHIDNLLAVGIPHVDPAEALTWWVKHNSVTENGQKVVRSTKASTPVADRIREGARAKVFNSISATHRKGRYLDREGDTYTFKAHALAAWTQRMELSTTAA
jgi:hypothetical protein